MSAGLPVSLVVPCYVPVKLIFYSAVQMYTVGMGGSFPMLFWAVVLGCWSLEEFTLVVVGSMVAIPTLRRTDPPQQTWFLGYWSSQYEILLPWQVDSLR